MAKSRKDNRGRALKKGETQRKDGRYAYAYMSPYGKRKYIYATDLMELRKKEDKLVRDQLDGLDVYAAGESDLNFAFDRYISTKSELRKTTYTNYLYMYNKFVRNDLGKKKLGSIKYSDVLTFYYRLVHDKGVQLNTLETVHSTVHPSLQLAVRDGIIRNNPSDGVIAEMKKKSDKGPTTRHALTKEQQRAFLNYMKGDSPFRRWLPLFTVLLGTGCRIGEIVGLRWEDIDLDNRMISINHACTYYPRRTDTYKCEFEISLPKTEAGIRTIPMLNEVYEAFMEEKEWQRFFGENTMVISGMSGFIFSNRFGNVHNPEGVNRAIRRISESYNAEELVNAAKEHREPVIIPHFSCHHLRHTFCTRFCESETNIKVIQAIMGHSDIETTMNIYAEVTEDKKKESFENLTRNMSIF